MKHILKVFILLILISSSAFGATYKSTDGKMVLTAPNIEYLDYKVVAKSPAHIVAADSTSGVSFDAKADSIAASFFTNVIAFLV